MKNIFLTDDRILGLTLVKVKNAVFDNPRTLNFKSKYECLDEYWLWTVCQVCVSSTEGLLASKSRLGNGTCSRRYFCRNWKTFELFRSAVPPLGREGAGRYPKFLFALMGLSLMAENLQRLMASGGHGDCGIKSEVSLTGTQAQLGTLPGQGDSVWLALLNYIVWFLDNMKHEMK